jgi:hypothetical protein
MLPPVDIAHVALEARRLCAELAQCHADTGAEPGLDPANLCDALQQGLAALDALGSCVQWPSPMPGQPHYLNVAAGPPATGARDLDTLGNECIDLLGRLAALAGRLRLPQHARQVEALALPLACWMARRGGELAHPAPVVNAAGALANSTKAPDELAALYGLMSEVVDALSPKVTQDGELADSTRPWRVLLLNRAIVATRSHRPDLMESAFKAVVDGLPGDAPEFFREAMGQMEALNYPPQVRTVVQRYADAWCVRRTLH